MKSALSLILWLIILPEVYSQRPNILIITGDDMRYDYYEEAMRPPWLDIPAIDKIRHEGVTFDNAYCVYSLCVPGRASILTGLYPHHHGAIDNFTDIDSLVPTLATIFDSAGYTNGFIGKYHSETKIQPGWTYWFAFNGETKDNYVDPKMNFADMRDTTHLYGAIIPGYSIEILTDSARKFISTADTPFVLCMWPQETHKPITLRPEEDSLYAGEQMPFPDNFTQFPKPYPSFLYERAHYDQHDTARLISDYETYFEGLKSIDWSVGEMLEALEERGILDNTFIVFTADNGAIYGEHLLAGKGYAYDPSARIPLFIRYPQWYGPAQHKTSLVANIDIMPTLLKAAGISLSNYHFDGKPLSPTGFHPRKYLLYENIKFDHPETNGDTATTPSIRAVISKDFKYIRYNCEYLTEELFNRPIDPEENHNLVENILYSNILNEYRYILDSLQMALGDTVIEDTVIKDCRLIRPPKDVNSYDVVVPSFDFSIFTFNNPGADIMIGLKINSENNSGAEADLKIYNVLGQEVYEQQFTISGEMAITVPANKLLDGGVMTYYNVVVHEQNRVQSAKVIVIK